MKAKSEQIPLPNKVIEIRNAHGNYEKVAELPPQGHVRITVKKRPPAQK